jgi:hypothetical protein
MSNEQHGEERPTFDDDSTPLQQLLRLVAREVVRQFRAEQSGSNGSPDSSSPEPPVDPHDPASTT